MNPGTEIILAIIYAVAKDKPLEVRKQYAKIMRDVLVLDGKEKEQ